MDKTLKEKLSSLNPEKLAKFLENEAIANPDFMESVERLAHHDSPIDILQSILEEIKSISRSQKFIDWRESSAFSQRLATLLHHIDTLLLPDYPKEALQALDSFLKISAKVIERVDDSNGNVGDQFRYAVTLWGKTWNLMPDVEGNILATAIWKYFDNNDYGLYDDMIFACEAVLKRAGLFELTTLVKKKCTDGDNPSSLFHALHDLAMIQQSPQFFMEAFQLTNKKMNVHDQLELAKLFIDTSHVNEAIDLLESITSDYEAYKRVDLLIEAYAKKGLMDRVQKLRWDTFILQRRQDLFKTYYNDLSSDREKNEAIDSAIAIALTWEALLQKNSLKVSYGY